ncbi:hypothetical protein A5777_08125 [Gordonia sp. 852002-10350_SCH5691597]|nr:hypothetical protein A5777_08125 [Gordonia sp. 852002-10350_SCH5691597]
MQYTTVLIVDHRTQISPAIQDLADQGKLTIVREELFDNVPHGDPQPKPFTPSPGWTPPHPENQNSIAGCPSGDS